MAPCEFGFPAAIPVDVSKTEIPIPQAPLAVVAGHRVTQIARVEGIRRPYASKEVHPPETQQYLLDRMEQHYAQIKECFAEAHICIREALQARRIHILKDGTKIDAGPDHYARMNRRQAVAGVFAGRKRPSQALPQCPVSNSPARENRSVQLTCHSATSPWRTLAQAHSDTGEPFPRGKKGAPADIIGNMIRDD